MIEFLESTWIFIKELGVSHNVNPILFGVLYVGSIPPYVASMGWIVKNFRTNKSLALPIISTLVFFILPASYIAIFGENVAWWVYFIIAFLLVYGGYTAVKTVKKRLSHIAD